MRCARIAAAAACLCFASRADAEGPTDEDGHVEAQRPVEPEELRGIERPAHQAAEPSRYLTNALLWPVRLTVDFLFLASGTAGGLLENEQIVPRVHELFFTSRDELGIFPTFFLETGSTPNIGARFVANIEPFAATMRAGYGGQDQNVVESRMRLRFGLPQPAILSLEGLHDRRTGRGFSGVGQNPTSDPRNQFRGDPAVGVFRERRERLVVGLGLRALDDFEVLFSSSITQRYIDDPLDAPAGTALTQVFLPGSIPGALTTEQIMYSELALRLDTRSNRTGGEIGVLFEGYGGVGAGVFGTPSNFSRVGFQAAGFFAVRRSSNVISPKITVDALASTAHEQLPFTELVGQPTFRGFDDRRDNLSVVASVDYRWPLVRFVAARLFCDVARVFPSVSQLSVTHLRWVAGLGFDLSSSTTEIGRIALALGPEGRNFLFTLGVPVRFGDRQHRD
jgi:hypothetical protein